MTTDKKKRKKKSRPRRPARPGVYMLKDESGRVIYVGKARNLRSRLRAYTGAADPPDTKTAVLRVRTVDIDCIVTESETEALILESNLIKEHHPRYNVKLRDDKRYPFIKVTLAEAFPRAHVTRLIKEDGSRYFGPYTDAKAMRRTLKLVGQIFPIRTCKTFKRRPRPCLNFQIGRCLGPCGGEETAREYREAVAQLCLFLDGRADDVVTALEKQMTRAVDGLRFEEAATIRDRIADVRKVAQRQRVLIARDVDRDVVGLARHERHAMASVLRVRHGKLVACENCPLDLGPDTEHDEIIETFLKQFYRMSSDLPPEIIVDRDPPDRKAIENWLSSRAGRTVRCRAPKSGQKRLLVNFAEENAEQAIRRSFRLRRPPKAVVELGEALGLGRPPRLISAVDVSNIQGAHAVGTVITLRDGRPDKALYRKYRIKTVKGSDDCAMIREVVARHFKRIAKEDRELPDLLLVDGGKGQLAAAGAAVREAGVKGVSLVALAKRDEEVFVPGRARPLPVADGTSPKRLLQRARDEVHRFSVSYHRSVRERTVRDSLLDRIPGVGETRKAALLRRFGSVAAISERSAEELAEVPGIGIETARKIKEALEEAQRGNRAAG